MSKPEALTPASHPPLPSGRQKPDFLFSAKQETANGRRVVTLTPRERQALKLYQQGHSLTEIANMVSMSRSGVHACLTRITKKVGEASITELRQLDLVVAEKKPDRHARPSVLAPTVRRKPVTPLKVRRPRATPPKEKFLPQNIPFTDKEQQLYELLRGYSKSEPIRMADIAAKLFNGNPAETLNTLDSLTAKCILGTSPKIPSGFSECYLMSKNPRSKP